MINGDTSQFLDTGWMNEATLYYKGFIYWFEGGISGLKDENKGFYLLVYKFKAEIIDKIYFKRVFDNGDDGFEYLLDTYAQDEDSARKIMLEAKIFEGKSFWEVENELAWYDE